MILVIDNYDSFTYNLVQYLSELGESVEVFRNDAISPDEIAAMAPDSIVISPGPGTPTEAGISCATIERFAAIVNRAGYASPIRTPRGRDILAACGQLKSESEKMRASERRRLLQAEETATD